MVSSKLDVTQFIARGLRDPHQKAEIIHFKESQHQFDDQYKARMKYFKEEGYEIEYIGIEKPTKSRKKRKMDEDLPMECPFE